MECRELEEFVDAYVDGEFDALECSEVESHLSGCPACQAMVASHARFKRFVHDACSLHAPDALRARIAAELVDVDAVEEEPSADDLALFGRPVQAVSAPWWRSALPGRRSAPVLGSVAVLLAFVWLTGGGFAHHEPVVDDAVRKHVRGLPLEVTGPAPSLQGWLRGKVDFNPKLLNFDPTLQPLGARLSHVRDRPAVYVVYGRPGSGPEGDRRISLFVFADPHLELEGRPEAHRQVRDRDVVLANRKGYNVAIWREDEIVYSLVSDLDEPTLLQLIEQSR